MQALDLLTGIKRQLDQTEGGQGSDDQKDEPATKHRRCEDEGEDSHNDEDEDSHNDEDEDSHNDEDEDSRMDSN
ncbi:hypothetical protein BGZ59_007537 [Podila verticillata]|nr:hypothetical protein BGZ59_007537 [Podila verticillata]